MNPAAARFRTAPPAVLLLALAVFAAPAAAQEPPPAATEARTDLEACIAAAEATDSDTAIAAADRAEAGFVAWAEAAPEDPAPRIGRARVLAQCRIPFAPFMEQGVLVGRSNALLEEALELDPTHWEARYALALNHYFTPEFLGRTKDSIEHFEILLEQQGDRTDFPEMAAPYAWLGDLYQRVGRPEDALEVWRRGAALFPGDPRLTERLAGAPAPDDTTSREGAAEAAPIAGGAPTAPAAAAPTPIAGVPADELADGDTVNVEAIVVNVDGGYAMDDARPAATLKRIDVYMAPGGTADILQVFQMLPGATRASEGSDLYVRGGDPAESPVLIDGARLTYAGVFETLHGGVFGVLDPSVLEKAYFSSGGFSARYGDALSGVVELETDGRPGVATWRAGWNFAGAGATLRRPLAPGLGAWATVRATEISLLLALHGGADEYEDVPRSIEGAAGIEWAPRKGLEVKAMGLAMADHAAQVVEAIGWEGPFESSGRTALALVSARALSDDATRSLRATASWTGRRSEFEFGVLDRDRRDATLALRIEGELAPSAARAVRAGLEARRLSARETGTLPTTERLDPGAPSEAAGGIDDATAHVGGWIEGELRPVPALALVAGARADRLPGESVVTFDPRLAVAYATGDWTLRATASWTGRRSEFEFGVLDRDRRD
ncbi:MAG TPA: tetratricopeptide repeat protein, partial [Gemmatimonadota bacterium]|nr:tetratricopeptide repeat protein [Gemmatimonadota bacterium]